MPVFLDRYSPMLHSKQSIRVGLVNNMSDEALSATERQYISLLGEASEGMDVRLSFFTLPGIAREPCRTASSTLVYSDIEDLLKGSIDGLIVTGREPLTPDLRDEPYWESFQRILDFAQQRTESTIWSCLAAHAAVLSMDQIPRIKRDEKIFGIFECRQEVEHSLTAAMPSRFSLPHSRWNTLSAAELTAAGYNVLTTTSSGDVDIFVHQSKKLFVFFQGHPEYESHSLLREYRRDIGRYFRHQSAEYPGIPQNYFDHATAKELAILQRRAFSEPGTDLSAEVAATLVGPNISHAWAAPAKGLYANWLQYLRTQKDKYARSRSMRTPISVPHELHRTEDLMSADGGA